MNRIIDTIINNYKLVLIAIIVVSIPFGFFYFQQKTFNHIDVFFEEDDPDLLYYKNFQKNYGNEEMGILVFKDKNIFSKEKIEIIREISNMAKNMEGIQKVISLTEAKVSKSDSESIIFEKVFPDDQELTPDFLTKAREKVLSTDIFKRSIISEDGSTTAITIELKPLSSNEEKREILKRIKKKAYDITKGKIDIHFTGAPFIEVEINRLTKLDNMRFTPIGVILILLIIALLLKRLALSILAEINIFLALLWGIGLLTLCGEKMNIVTVIIPPVLLAIAVAASIHILSHYRELHIIDGLSHMDAVGKSIKSLWYPCLFTSLTTGIGFFSFITTSVRPVKIVGLFTSIGIMFSFILTISFLPVALIIIRKRLEIKNPIKKTGVEDGAGSNARSSQHGDIQKEDNFTKLLNTVGKFTIKFYIPISIISVIIITLAIIGMFKLNYETNFANYLPESNQIKQDINFVEKNLGGSVPVVMLLKAKSPEYDFTHPESLKLLEYIQKDAMKFMKGQYTWSFSVADYFKEMNMAYNSGTKVDYKIPEKQSDIIDYFEIGDSEDLDSIVSFDKMEARLSFVARLDKSTTTRKESEKLRSRIRGYIGDNYTLKHTGSGPLYGVMEVNLKDSQIKSFFSAFVVVFIMMFIICKRNFKLTLVSMIPNLFPILLTLGVMGWLGLPLDVSTIMIASITIGIAVDDTIHYLTWFRRNMESGLDIRVSLLKTYKDTGKPIVITSVVLCACYLILVTGSIKPIIAFGLLTSLSMFLALVGDLLVFPAVILLFKPKLRQEKAF